MRLCGSNEDEGTRFVIRKDSSELGIDRVIAKVFANHECSKPAWFDAKSEPLATIVGQKYVVCTCDCFYSD